MVRGPWIVEMLSHTRQNRWGDKKVERTQTADVESTFHHRYHVGDNETPTNSNKNSYKSTTNCEKY